MKIPTKAQHGNASLIPTTPPPNQTCPKRRVQIGSRPIGGRATTWTVGVFLEFLKRVGNIYVRSKEEAPDPHFHWCVIVGEYYHQAQIDLDGRMLYDNGSVSWSKLTRWFFWAENMTELLQSISLTHTAPNRRWLVAVRRRDHNVQRRSDRRRRYFPLLLQTSLRPVSWHTSDTLTQPDSHKPPR